MSKQIQIGDKVRFTRKYQNSYDFSIDEQRFANSYGRIVGIGIEHNEGSYEVNWEKSLLIFMYPKEILSVLRPKEVLKNIITKSDSCNIKLTQEDIDKLKPGDIIEGGKVNDGEFEYQHCYNCDGEWKDTYVLNVSRYEFETDDEVIERDKQWDEMLANKKEERKQQYEQLKKEFGNE